MTEKERLMQLINQVRGDEIALADYEADILVEHLLANGVIVQKQGEWEATQEPLGWKDVECIECSACHESWICDEENDFECYEESWKYCPNCGARMLKELGK